LAPPPPQQAAASSLLRASPPADAASVLSAFGFCLGHAPSRRTLPAASATAFSRSAQEQQTRLAPPPRRTSPWPVNGLPARLIPRGVRGPSVSMSSSNFDASSATPTQNTERAVLERLPGPHLTRQACLFPVAHHDGLQPTQHRVVWRLPPQADAGGPASISRTAPHSKAPPTWCAPPPAFVTHLTRLLTRPTAHVRRSDQAIVDISARSPGTVLQTSYNADRVDNLLHLSGAGTYATCSISTEAFTFA
jgi:hypothetical protein